MIWHKYNTLEEAASTLADVIHTRLKKFHQSPQNNTKHALLAFPGGSTPAPLFQQLHHKVSDWSHTLITLGDERWVDSNHPRSNFAMMQRNFGDVPQKATCIALYRSSYQHTPEQAIPMLQKEIFHLHNTPLQCVLGMGEDGHFASLFPNMPNLEQGLFGKNKFILCRANDEVRISMTLHAIESFQHIALFLQGKKKIDLLTKASHSSLQLPISYLLQHKNLEIFSS